MSLARRISGEDSRRAGEKPQAELIAAMEKPAFYPRSVREVTHHETHISHVFFIGDVVYKVKKAVRYSFLDYSTLDRRRYFLQEELRLNRRLAPSVYLGILPISDGAGRWQLGSDVNPVEYVLVMRRLPAKRMLDFLLEHAQVTESMMSSLAELLASFHSEAATGGRIDAHGDPEAIQRVWSANLTDLRPFISGGENEEKFRALQEWGAEFVATHRELMARRVREGRIRDGHGDLHCEHICFAPEGIQIFDCVEFSPKLRYCDIASEVAFLIMDMEMRGGAEWAHLFLERYSERVADREIPVLLPFYRSYRALIRTKVHVLRSGEFSGLAKEYFDFAHRCMRDGSKPRLIVVCGLSGTGKSTLARALGRWLGLPVICSDEIRKSLFGAESKNGRAAYGEGLYNPAKTAATYESMAVEAGEFLARKKSVIVDATFQRQGERERMMRLAVEHDAALFFICCRAPDKVVRRRLLERSRDGRDPSDAGWEVYLKQKEEFEPLASSDNCVFLDTVDSPSKLCGRVERLLNELGSKMSPG